MTPALLGLALLASTPWGTPVPPSPQRAGDPSLGRAAFEGGVGCGLPAASCQRCHSAPLGDETVVGLGNSQLDFSQPLPVPLVGPWLRTRAAGVNPADNLAAILFTHRDPKTLRWSLAPMMKPPPREPLPVDVPPLWRLAKKNALYATGAGRGDQARLMMTAALLCAERPEAAARMDARFPDVAAWLRTLPPPRYPGPVDDAAAARGRALFEIECADCHGRYGPGDPAFPNLIVPVDEVETDPALARADDARFRGWFNRSWFAADGRAHLVDTDGYLAPPLDGIWATAPYLHNGSVPTLRALLDPGARPTRWTRSFDRARLGEDYDLEAVGWRHRPPTRADARRRRVYDARWPGYGNGGHTYAAHLDDDERADLLEYLKTL